MPLPLLVSVATEVSSPYAFAALDWNPLPSPPLSGALPAGLLKAGAPPPPLAAVTERPAVRLLLPAVAVTVTTAVVPTGVVVAVNVAPVAPAGTTTLDGVAAAAELSESAISMPPPGAAAVNVTVPVVLAPPVTLDGFSVSDDSDGELPHAAGGGTSALTLTSSMKVRPVVVLDSNSSTTLEAVAGNHERPSGMAEPP